MEESTKDTLNWNVHATVEKYDRATLQKHGLLNASIEEIRAVLQPDEVVEADGNSLLNEGINRMLNLLIGGGGTPFSNANAQLGVGNSTTAVSASQTDLQGGANTAWTGMDSGYPSIAGQTVTFKGTFGDSVANFAWNEWGIRNGSGANENLNRKVVSLGTKAGGVWSLTTSISIS
jgi:hypothetical protein